MSSKNQKSEEKAPGAPANPEKKPRDLKSVALKLLIVQVAFWAVWFGTLAFSGAHDRGIRLFLLNHTPDELVVVNADNGAIEKRMAIADGVKELVFSSDGAYAYISNVVDVSNKVTVIDARTYLKYEVIEVDGIPQDLAIFPDNRRLVVVNGARTDFMSNGFDVFDLSMQSETSRRRKRVLYRARDMRLVSSIYIDYTSESDLVYAIDSKDSKIWVYDVSPEVRELIDTIELNGAPISLHFPEEGPYFFASSIRREMVFVIDRKTREIVKKIRLWRCRQLTSNRDGSTLYIPLTEKKELAIVDVEAGTYYTAKIPYRSEVIESSPYYDVLYLVDTTLEGRLFVVDIESLDKEILEENGGEAQVIYEKQLIGEFRDIDVRPMGK